MIRLQNGNLLMAHNPTSHAPRSPLRLSISEDGGETWPWWVDVETDLEGRFDYPYLIQADNGTIHLGYTHNNKRTKRHSEVYEQVSTCCQFVVSEDQFSSATN